MPKFQILCVTMHQKDFSKIEEMNIRSDVIFANQANCTEMKEIEFGAHHAKMITTNTRGVGINRNLTLLYANADICLLADDDVRYSDSMEADVISEFDAHPDADIIIFHLETDDPVRRQIKYARTRKCKRFERMPWGAFRVAFRLSSVKKANLWFTTLFGGGCVFPSGEDSMWLNDAKRSGLVFYVSDKSIGKVSFAESSWYTGADEKFFYAKGAYYEAVHTRTAWLWRRYFAYRTKTMCEMPRQEKIKWMKNGASGYKQMLSFDEFRRKR